MAEMTPQQLSAELREARWLELGTPTDDQFRRRVLRNKQRRLLFANRPIILEALAALIQANERDHTEEQG